MHQALLENGLETRIDWQDIPPSADWLAEVYEAIEGADAFVFIISETSLASEICGLEMTHAAKHNKRLIPIAIKDLEAEKVPRELSVLNWIFFDEAGEKFTRAMNDLVTTITVDQAWVKGHTGFDNRALDWERKARDRGTLCGEQTCAKLKPGWRGARKRIRSRRRSTRLSRNQRSGLPHKPTPRCKKQEVP